MSTINELRELNVEELHGRAADLKQAIFDLKSKKNTGILDSTADLKRNRRDVARCLTVAREQELGIKREPKADKPAKKGKE